MDAELRRNLIASRELEHALTGLWEDNRLAPAERDREIRRRMAVASSTRVPLVDAWKEAGSPTPLGYQYSARADRAEWFEGWREVESLVLDLQEDGSLGRGDVEVMILEGRPPFDDVLEAEELGAIYRNNEEPPDE